MSRPVGPVALPDQLPGSRQTRANQQPGGAEYETLCDLSEKKYYPRYLSKSRLNQRVLRNHIG